MWCMPFEMFLILLKGFCEDSNWKTVPFTVVTKWAMRRNLLQRENNCDALTIDADDIDVHACSAFLFGPTLQAALTTSKILSHAALRTQDHHHVLQARNLNYFRREQVEIRPGDWVLLVSNSQPYAARVHEMAQFIFPGGSRKFRLYCTDCRSLKDHTEDHDAMIRVSQAQPAKSMFVRVEHASITQLLLKVNGPTLEFRYVL